MEESDQTLRMGDSHYTDSVEIPLKLHFRRNVQKGSRIRFRSLTKVWSSKKFLSLVFSFTHTYNTSDTRCVPFPPRQHQLILLHQLAILQFNSILTLIGISVDLTA